VIFKYELPETDEFLVNADNLDKIISYYQSAFYCGNTHYEKLLNAKTDIQCKNITRLSGLAHDPDVFLRPESEAVAAMATVALFGLLPQCASFTATQAEDSSITISCEMSDGSKAEYLISADAANVAIAEAAGAEAPSED
jgi:hypothetical protein